MSDFATCLAWTLHNEDSQLTYEATPDIGGFAIAGINSHVWPASYAYIAGLPVTERAAAVSTFYRCKFWAPAMAKIVSNEVAKRLFDCAVNEGFETAVCIFQRAIADLSGIIDEDGKLGKGTVDRANLLDPDKLVRAFQNERVTAYEKIVAEHPKEGLLGRLVGAGSTLTVFTPAIVAQIEAGLAKDIDAALENPREPQRSKSDRIAPRFSCPNQIQK